MQFLDTVQSLILYGLTYACFALEVWALVDAARQRKDAYTAAGKLTKTYWLIILGVAMALGVLSLNETILGPNSFLYLLAVVAAGVYLTNVRPALLQIQGKRGSGPHGPW
jgi:4-amino-4-deoxy-L-arabinose transferase-like glycosyltransferase